ncbi:MAG TPA: hypothetical protein VE258_09210, partial [Ktedonobacterales bacterium]|nr:hypothetical protein [Ktedonobacterales bacterium]
ARFFAETDEVSLRYDDYEAVRARLLAVQGIGAWSAQFILVRGLGRMERMPVDEQELLRAIGKAYGATVADGAEAVAALARRYASNEGYWALYLRTAFPRS